MDLILLERVEKLGQMGDLVSVKDGYARNFLLPQKKAMRATPGNKRNFEAQKAQLEADNLKRRDEAQAIASEMNGLKVILIRAAGDSGQLYGSVTSRHVAESITESGIKIVHNQVVLDRAIKNIGLHDIRIRLHPEVTEVVRLNIARSADEAETQFSTGSAVTGNNDFDEDEDTGIVDGALEAAADLLSDIAEKVGIDLAGDSEDDTNEEDDKA